MNREYLVPNYHIQMANNSLKIVTFIKTYGPATPERKRNRSRNQGKMGTQPN